MPVVSNAMVKTTISGAIHDEIGAVTAAKEKVLTRNRYPTIVQRNF